MELTSINSAITNSIKVKQLSKTEFQLTTCVSYPNKQPIILFIQKIGSNWLMTDKKQTLKQMNSIFDLKSKDVKKCINNIITAYAFKMQSGILLTEIDELNLSKKLIEFLMCISQLVNMYVFFDEPS
jgi:hypothetical protein